MSLKNILKKSIATLGATTLIFGNFSFCGLGIGKVIAENLNAPEITVEIINESYVQYKEIIQKESQEALEEVACVAINSRLEVYPTYIQDEYMSTERVEINLNLPQINGYFPEKVTVVGAITKSTTGDESNTNINQNYDSNSGLLTIDYENTPDENGNIYSTYIENSKDEFEIIYIYPADAYTGNDNELELDYTINTIMTFKTENESVISKSTTNIKLIEKDNRGSLATFGVTESKENIYKGFMFSNVHNGTSYDTEYATILTFAVLNSSIVEETTVKVKESEFVLNDEDKTQVATNGNVVCKTTQIKKDEFDKILGQEGILEIYNAETLLATIKYVEVSENEEIVKKLAVIYNDGRINLAEDGIVIIEYSENVISLDIKISKPIAEGFIHFENQNMIKAADDYGCKIETIKYLSTECVINGNANITEIELLEPETKISATLSNKNFSTLQTNKTTLTINLDNTKSSSKLFDNPTIEINLPEGIEGGNVSSPNIINGNGLKIKGEPRLSEDGLTIVIELSGKQTNYDLNSVSNGTSIVMDIENLDFNDTLPTHTDKIEVVCMQENEKTIANCDVNIVSKEGLLIMSELSNYNNSNDKTVTIDNNVETVILAEDAKLKEAIYTVNLVNNYDENLVNVQILGTIGYSNSELASTFDIKLTKPIELNVDNATVYYSTNKNATYEDDSWTEEFSSESKAYKIVLNNNQLEKASVLEIKGYVQIPENTGSNKKTYLNCNVNYDYQERNIQSNSTIGIKTQVSSEETTPTEKKISTTLRTDAVGISNVIYRPGDIIEYYISVNNISDEVLSNIDVCYDIVEGLEYIEGGIAKYDQFEGYQIQEEGICSNNIFEYTIDKLEVGEEKVISIKTKVEQTSSEYKKEISSFAKIVVNDEVYTTNTKTVNMKMPKFNISLSVNTEGKEVLRKNDSVIYTIKIENIGEISGNFAITDKIPEQLKVLEIKYSKDGSIYQQLETVAQEIELVNSLNAGEVLTVQIITQVDNIEVLEDTILTAINKATLTYGDETITSGQVKVNIKPEIKVVKDEEVENPVEEEKGNSSKEEENGEDTKTEGDNNEGTNNENNQNQQTEEYSLSGIAWIDNNKDGKKDENENLKSGIKVSLVDKNIGNFALDKDGNRITASTNAKGEYRFDNVKKGTYIVVFEFDTTTYTATTYKKTSVEESNNSDVILTMITIDGSKKTVAVTDNITLDSNKGDINIGLIENSEFDLALNKEIKTITVINSKGTETYEYNSDTAKVDLVAKYMKDSEVIVTYKFIVTNKGDVTGYVNSLVDNLPSGLKFSSELNSDWYKGTDGNLYTTAYSEKAIKPGESLEIELVLTKKMTEDNAGIFANNAELEKISNLENISEKEEDLENNKSSAMIIISIKTGSIILYIAITLACISIIAVGTYLIKKKVLGI